MARLTKVRVDLFLPDEVIEFLKEEAERRSADSDDQQWTWRQLAWVRCSIMLEDWATETRKRRAKEAEAIRCTCGADRTGPSAEAHDDNCPQAITE